MEFLRIIIVVFLYFLPSIIGYKKKNAKTIFVINLLLGLSVIGWIVAMVMAFKKEKEEKKQITNDYIEPIKPHNIELDYENSMIVYLSGSHIPTRKNYILKNGWDSMPVELEAEPNNKFDKNAIAVKHFDKILGHIPADKTHLVHPILLEDHYARFDSMEEEDSFTNPGEIHLKVYLKIFYN